MAHGSSSRSGRCSSSSDGRRSSSRRNPHGGFHCIASRRTGGGSERKRVPINADEAYLLYWRYEAVTRDVEMPDMWHRNPNSVPIPPPPTGRERSLAIAERRRLAGPELLADPRFAGEGPAWDDLFQQEHDIVRASFFAAEPPEWFLCESVSPTGSDDEDAAKGPDGRSSSGCGGGCADASSSSAPVIFID